MTEPQPQPQPMQSSGISIQPGLTSNIAELVLKFDDLLTKTERNLRGYTYDSYASTWKIEKDAQPYMNNKGISYTMMTMNLIFSKIILIGDRNEEQTYEELYTLLTRYAIWLRVHAKEIDFDVQFYHPFMSLLMTLFSSIYSASILGLHKDFVLGIAPKALEREKKGGSIGDVMKL